MHGNPILLSDMSGSLGGNVFYNSRHGQIVRLKVTPVQPNTVAQNSARSAFGIAATGYRSLTGSQKNTWNGFARGNYSPKNNTNKGQFTGQIAYNAINISFQNSQRMNSSYNFFIDGAPLPSGFITLPFEGSPVNSPSGISSVTNVITVGGSVGVSLINASVEADGRATITLQIGNGSGTDIPGFTNAFGTNTGYAVYLSSSNPTSNMNIRNMEKYLLSYFNPPEAVNNDDIDNVGSFGFESLSPLNVADYQGFPQGGEICVCSVYMVTTKNQMNLVGRKEVTILA